MTDEPLEMTDVERLAQRFVDQELSAEERISLLARIGRDESVRRHLLSLERLALDVSQLPRPLVPTGFVGRVLQKTETGVAVADAQGSKALLANAMTPHKSWLWTPRVLHWNLASAAAVAAVIALALAAAVTAGLSWQQTPASEATLAQTPHSSTMLVRLIVMQPDAKTVAVAGDFNGWNPARTQLERISGDAWAVTIPLQPGRYEYMFVVNGNQWIADPFATEQRDDGFGSQNAVLDVRPQVTPL